MCVCACVCVCVCACVCVCVTEQVMDYTLSYFPVLHCNLNDIIADVSTQVCLTDPTLKQSQQHHQTPLTNAVILRVVELKQTS